MNIWEQNIKEWYEKSEISRLNYLDLAPVSKPTTKELAHNISVIYDRVCLSSKVTLKEFRDITLQNQLLSSEVEKLKSKVIKLEKEIVNLTSFLLAYKPLTKQEVKQLVEEIAQQPKIVEEQAINLLHRYKRLNDNTHKDQYSLPGINTIMAEE